MKRAMLFLTVCLLSCAQPSQTAKQAKDSIPSDDNIADSTIDDFVAGKAAIERDFLLYKDSTAFSSQDFQTAILIGHLFEKETKDAILRYSENDSVARLIVLRETGKNWDTIISERLYPASSGDWSDLIEVSDFNGDNIPDLKVVKEHWDFHTGENADLWLYSNRRFTKVKGFDKIVTPTFYKPANLIYAYQSMGCADMSMYFGVFKLAGDSVQTVKEMSCDCCSDSGDSCEIKVYGEKPFMVPAQKAYQYVPDMYAEGVKEKCEMGKGK